MSAIAVSLVLPVAPAATAAPSAETLPLNSTAIPDRFAAQLLDWHLCRADELPFAPPAGAEHLECATYRTPRDWDNLADKRELTIAISRLPSTGVAKASVVINPGGPGQPGRIFAAKLRRQKELLAEQEVIGFDVRGTGHSTNVSCGGAFGRMASGDSRDRADANLRLILNNTKGIVEECQRNAGDLGPVISTLQTIKDMDLLRVLLRRPKINYVGWSGGTWLGAYYAQAYPKRVGNFALDSVVRFTGSWEENFRRQPMGYERKWRVDFLPWMAKYDKVYGFGTTSEDVRQQFEQMRKVIAAKPIVYNGVRLSPDAFDQLARDGIYYTAQYPTTASMLVDIRTLTSAAPAAAKSAAAQRIQRRQQAVDTDLQAAPMAADAYPSTFWSILCNDGPWPTTEDGAIKQSQQFLDDGLTLAGGQWVMQPCMYWNRPPTQFPVIDGKGVPPVLLVQSERDPATPIEGALEAHAGFANSRLLTVTDEGQHGIYASNPPYKNLRVDELVDTFLLTGQLPAEKSVPGMPPQPPPGG
ncbi:alpha/beta hydrolase [Kribbella sandramycini]